MLDSFLLSMDHISLESWVKVTWVTKHLEVPADSLLSLVLGLSLNIDVLVLYIEVTHDFVQELEQFKRGFVVEFHQRKVAHERWAVKTVDDLLDINGCEVWSF